MSSRLCFDHFRFFFRRRRVEKAIVHYGDAAWPTNESLSLTLAVMRSSMTPLTNLESLRLRTMTPLSGAFAFWWIYGSDERAAISANMKFWKD